MKLILKLTFLVVILSSCNKKPFENIKFANGNYKLYCFAIPNDDLISNTSNKFHDEQKNFVITDKDVLKLTSNEIIGEKTSRNVTSQSLYILRLIKDKKVIDGGFLDTEGGIFIGGSKYNFDMKKFIDKKGVFKKLSSYRINVKTISNTQNFINFIDNSNGYIFNDYLKDYESRLKGYSGITKLLTDTSIINLKVNGIDDIEKQINNDFKQIDNFKIKEFSTLERGFISISILSEKDISNQIPNGYKIIEEYSDSIGIPIFVYDIDRDKITDFLNSEGISNYTIDDLNIKNNW